MTRMVQVAIANDVTEAEEIQSLLRDAGIESAVEPGEDDSLSVVVPDHSVSLAQDAIEALTEPDELSSSA